MTYVPQAGYQIAEFTLGSALADDGTVEVSYPTGSTQATFAKGLYKAGEGHVMLNNNDKLEDADPGVSFTFGASTITITNLSGASIPAGTKVLGWLPVWASQPVVLTLPVFALAGVSAADVVTTINPGIDGYITYVEWVQGVPVTTAAKAATLNLEIGTTNVTGGTVALTSAACTPLGKVIAGSAITAENRLEKGDTLSVEASSVTAFVEGSGSLLVYVQRDVL